MFGGFTQVELEYSESGSRRYTIPEAKVVDVRDSS
jgi:hypothetical protein